MDITINNYNSLYKGKIDRRESFEIFQVPISEMISICGDLEDYIESQNLKCRIYTEKRYAGLLAGALNKQYGVLGALFIVAHNLITWNPDYEISRDLANNRINVKYKK